MDTALPPGMKGQKEEALQDRTASKCQSEARASANLHTMYTLRCTAKLRDWLKRPFLDPMLPPSTVLGDWYATALVWRPQLTVLVNERTLLPVLMPLAPAATLPERASLEVARTLKTHGVGRDFIERELAAMDEVEIAKTANRSVVGTMNEFAFEAEVYREDRRMTDPLHDGPAAVGDAPRGDAVRRDKGQQPGAAPAGDGRGRTPLKGAARAHRAAACPDWLARAPPLGNSSARK